MSGWRLAFAVFGAVVLMAAVDGVIAGTAQVFLPSRISWFFEYPVTRMIACAAITVWLRGPVR